MYMGEIVRLAIVDLTNQKKLFEGRLSEQMKTKGAFGTSFVSDIERCVATYYYKKHPPSILDLKCPKIQLVLIPINKPCIPS